jgi:hypothetical protein
MGISYINGWELDAPLETYTIDGAGATGNANGWVAYACQKNTYPSSHLPDLAGTAINTQSGGIGLINDAAPVGGGKRSLQLTAGNNQWIELLSPANLLDRGQTNMHGTSGKGLKRLGMRFFYKAPTGLEDNQEVMCRFYDSDLGRIFNNSNGDKIETGPPLFKLALSYGGQGNAGLRLYKGVTSGNEGDLMASSASTPFEAGAWSQVAIIVRLGPAQTNQETGELQGLVSVYNNGELILDYKGELLFDDSEATPAQGIEYFSLLASNSSTGENSISFIDNIVVYDFWNPGQNDFIDQTDAVIAQNQVIQGVYPVDLGEASMNSFGNYTSPDGSSPNHLNVQGDSSSTSNSPPDDPITYNGSTYLLSQDLSSDPSYSVDTWDKGKVHADWASNISEVKAVRVINVCAGSESGLKANLSINAKPSAEGGANHNFSLDKTLHGTSFQIISNTWDHNPDGGENGGPGPLNTHAIDSLIIGFKASEGG